MENKTPLLLSSRDAAKTLAISERTLYTLTQQGRIRAVRLGQRCVRFDVRDLEAFIQACKGATV
ncbi:MAG: helix-turn-helix domain-containing protein [Phycisphaerae bacterium]|nr:helix-turn-helix domain-containing protein [Phycisphaerae bacterium]